MHARCCDGLVNVKCSSMLQQGGHRITMDYRDTCLTQVHGMLAHSDGEENELCLQYSCRGISHLGVCSFAEIFLAVAGTGSLSWGLVKTDKNSDNNWCDLLFYW